MNQWTIMLQDKAIKSFTIKDGERLIIGRGDDAGVRVDNPAISRHHAALEIQNGKPFLQDLCSLNGTKVNGKPIDFIQISETDTITFGKFSLVAGIPEGSRQTLSSSAAPMDLEDATIFTPGKVAKPKQKKTGFALQVIGGSAFPAELDLAGRTSVKIGKDSNSDITTPGFFVGASQCYISLRDNGYHLIPQKSWTKTKVNHTVIRTAHKLEPGDEITIGKHRIKFISQ